MKENKDEKFITIRITKVRLKLLLNTIRTFSDKLYKWNFDRFFEDSLINDLKDIKSILDEAK
jgi:hypothetical protein